MPQAFAVIKETSRRLAENGQLKVLANDNDKLIYSIYPQSEKLYTVSGDGKIHLGDYSNLNYEISNKISSFDVRVQQQIGGDDKV